MHSLQAIHRLKEQEHSETALCWGPPCEPPARALVQVCGWTELLGGTLPVHPHLGPLGPDTSHGSAHQSWETLRSPVRWFTERSSKLEIKDAREKLPNMFGEWAKCRQPCPPSAARANGTSGRLSERAPHKRVRTRHYPSLSVSRLQPVQLPTSS